jgi:hypothetical protein|tara:strand:+ start:2966 stop:3238 length:273 start_codon:yes stop_codon:yes gene_type:complete
MVISNGTKKITFCSAMKSSKHSKKSYKDFVHNNPRADAQSTDWDAKDDENRVKDKMLYDGKDTLAKLKAILRKKKIAKLSNNDNHWKGLQ